MRKFWSFTEAAVANIEKLSQRTDLRVDYRDVEDAMCAGESLGLRDRIGKRIRRTNQIGPFIFEGISYCKQYPAKSRAAHLIFGREICATEKWFAIGQQKSRQWPATLTGNGADGGLIAGINVRSLVAIDFNGNEVFVDDF